MVESIKETERRYRSIVEPLGIKLKIVEDDDGNYKIRMADRKDNWVDVDFNDIYESDDEAFHLQNLALHFEQEWETRVGQYLDEGAAVRNAVRGMKVEVSSIPWDEYLNQLGEGEQPTRESWEHFATKRLGISKGSAELFWERYERAFKRTYGRKMRNSQRDMPLKNLIASESELEAISRGVAPEVYTYVYGTSDIPSEHRREAGILLDKREMSLPHYDICFKVPLKKEQKFIRDMKQLSVTVGTDAYYSDPDNFVSVIVRGNDWNIRKIRGIAKNWHGVEECGINKLLNPERSGSVEMPISPRCQPIAREIQRKARAGAKPDELLDLINKLVVCEKRLG